jgi:hypothetical protein
MDDVFDIGVSFSQKTAPRSAPMDISSIEFCPLLYQRGKNTSVLDKEECSTNVGAKLLVVCSFCGSSHGHLMPLYTSHRKACYETVS